MSTPPVPPPGPNDPYAGGSGSGSSDAGNGQSGQPPRYGENAPQYGQQGQNPPQYGQNPPQYGAQAPSAPQYGQNTPYGQNAPYGQSPQHGQNPQGSGYGQQPFGQSSYGQSPYAQYPSEQPQPAGANGVPQLVNISFWLLIASAVIFVVSLLTGLTQLDDPLFRETFEQQMEASGAAGQVTYEDIQGIIAGTLVVFAIIGAGLYLLVAFFVRKGKNWARILGTVFAALSVFGLFGPPSIGTLGTLLGIAAIVLLYLPASAPYFRKQQPFANPYGGGFGSPYGR